MGDGITVVRTDVAFYEIPVDFDEIGPLFGQIDGDDPVADPFRPVWKRTEGQGFDQYRQSFLGRGNPRRTDAEPSGPRLFSTVQRRADMHPAFMNFQHLQIEFGKCRLVVDFDLIATGGSIGHDAVVENHAKRAGIEISTQALGQTGDSLFGAKGFRMHPIQMLGRRQRENAAQAFAKLQQTHVVTAKMVSRGAV